MDHSSSIDTILTSPLPATNTSSTRMSSTVPVARMCLVGGGGQVDSDAHLIEACHKLGVAVIESR